MADPGSAHAAQSDSDLVQRGIRLGYGHWLQPIVDSNDMDQSSPPDASSSPTNVAVPRRGRGRPRVNKLRDESAIEKRRAQVRKAQRTYQKRKESVAASEKRRCDDLLEVLSDLSSDIEALLQTASKAGTLSQEDEVASQIQQLWSSYDTAISSPCVRPELRLLQVKNERRRAEHNSSNTFRIGLAPASPHEHHHANHSGENDSSSMAMSLVRVGESTLLQPLRDVTSTDRLLGGRTIFEIIKERQAAFHNS